MELAIAVWAWRAEPETVFANLRNVIDEVLAGSNTGTVVITVNRSAVDGGLDVLGTQDSQLRTDL